MEGDSLVARPDPELGVEGCRQRGELAEHAGAVAPVEQLLHDRDLGGLVGRVEGDQLFVAAEEPEELAPAEGRAVGGR